MGIWVFKGHELAFELDDNWQIDYASYNWKKLDSKSDDTKKLVDQYWKWEWHDNPWHYHFRFSSDEHRFANRKDGTTRSRSYLLGHDQPARLDNQILYPP